MEKKNELDKINQTKRTKTPDLIYKKKIINKKNNIIKPLNKPKKNETIKSEINSNLNREMKDKKDINMEQKRENRFINKTGDTYNKSRINEKKDKKIIKSVDNQIDKIKKKCRNKPKTILEPPIHLEINKSGIKSDNINNIERKNRENSNENEINKKVKENNGQNEMINNVEKKEEKKDEKTQNNEQLNFIITKTENFYLPLIEKQDKEIKEEMKIKEEGNKKMEKEKSNENDNIINKEENNNSISIIINNKLTSNEINYYSKKAQTHEKSNTINNKIAINNSIFEVEEIKDKPIENNNIKGKGVIKLIKVDKNNEIKIKKKLLNEVNSLVSCIGTPGAGKSTFCSNYYKNLFNVKKDYFESSDDYLTYTKGIWIISNKERRKIPIMIKKDLLDVEGFQVDDIKSWKYVMVIAFLSTDLIILNRNTRADDVKKIIRIIEKSLEIMNKKQIPRILKKIYIQTIISKPKKTIKEYIERFIENKKIFEGIKFEFLYLPSIPQEELLEQKDIMKFGKYRENFNIILKQISNSNLLKNSVSSLLDYIDLFNETIIGKSGFNKQTIYKDLESDFNGVYSRYEKQLKNELSQKIDYLIQLQSLEETFNEFIKKQKGLKFEFQIKNEDLTFYGSCSNFDNFYENLKKNKTFKIAPEEIFLDTYNAQKKLLEIKIKKEEFKKEKEKVEMEIKRKREEEKKRIQEEEKKMQKERKKREEMEKKEKKIREEQRKKEEEEEERKYFEQKKKRLLEQEEEEEKIRKEMEQKNKILEEEEKINNLYNLKIKEINNYFANLKFYEDIITVYDYDFQLYIITDQISLKIECEDNLKKHYERKITEKKKEWEEQIKRAKWKVRVQAKGLLKCENGCDLTDSVVCDKPCKGNLFWVDSDEKYAICNKCPEYKSIRKITEELYCTGCGARSLAEVKWIKGYKP